jgi:hypothetical protein
VLSRPPHDWSDRAAVAAFAAAGAEILGNDPEAASPARGCSCSSRPRPRSPDAATAEVAAAMLAL